MRTLTISTACAPTRHSSSSVAGYPTRATIYARSRPSRAERTRLRCAIWSAWWGWWSISIVPATQSRRQLRRSTSTIRLISFTAISRSHYSTPIRTNAVSCRSMSTTPRQAGRSPCCCAPARRHRAQRYAVTCVVLSVASAGTATDRDHHPWRRPLWPSGGHEVVWREWYRFHLRPARQRRARPAGRWNRRRHSHRPTARSSSRRPNSACCWKASIGECRGGPGGRSWRAEGRIAAAAVWLTSLDRMR